MASERNSKVFSVSFPPELAAKVESLAKLENRTISELFREAFRLYQEEHTRKFFEQVREYAATRNPMGYTEDDIPRLIKETRAKQALLEKTVGKVTRVRKTA